MNRPAIILAIVGLALIAWDLGAFAFAEPEPVKLPSMAWMECVTACERREPSDRGQGCIDVECNTLPLWEDEP